MPRELANQVVVVARAGALRCGDLPDEPRWVETRGLTRSPDRSCRPWGCGFVPGGVRAQFAVQIDVAAGSGVALGRELLGYTLRRADERVAATFGAAGRGGARVLRRVIPEPDALSEGLGLGTNVAAAMIHGERAPGRAPVWTALEDAAAAHALARRLGRERADALWVVAPEAAA